MVGGTVQGRAVYGNSLHFLLSFPINLKLPKKKKSIKKWIFTIR